MLISNGMLEELDAVLHCREKESSVPGAVGAHPCPGFSFPVPPCILYGVRSPIESGLADASLALVIGT